MVGGWCEVQTNLFASELADEACRARLHVRAIFIMANAARELPRHLGLKAQNSPLIACVSQQLYASILRLQQQLAQRLELAHSPRTILSVCPSALTVGSADACADASSIRHH